MKNTFTTEWGTFAFNLMPFGLCSAPGTFQRLMIDIFKDFLQHFLEVFIDNFVVFGDHKDHLEYLRRTFQRCKETNLKLHPGKCFLGGKSWHFYLPEMCGRLEDSWVASAITGDSLMAMPKEVLP